MFAPGGIEFTLGLAVLAGGLVLRQELPQMPEWVRPADAVLLFAAGSLLVSGGARLIVSRVQVAEHYLASRPLWFRHDPAYNRELHNLCSRAVGVGVVSLLMGSISLFVAFQVLVGEG